MFRRGTFIGKKYNSMLVYSLIGWFGYSLNLMLDSLISGLLFGEEMLAAVAIINPLIGIISFFSYAICPGFSVLFAQAVGQFDRKHASDIAGQSLVITTATSFVVALALFAIKEPFLVFFECTGDIYASASSYYNWTIAIALSVPLFANISCFVTSDGDGKIMACATISQVVINVILSIVLSKPFGVGGLAMATAIATFICVLVYYSHLFKKSNTIRFSFHFRWADIKQSIILSLNYCSRSLFVTLLDFILNKAVLVFCGLAFIPAYSIVNFVFAIFELYGAVADSAQGMLSSFLGERNNHAIRLLVRHVLKALCLVGVGLFLLFFFLAPLVPKIYGIVSPDVVSACIRTSRILSLCSIVYGVMYVANMNYTAIEHPYLSILSAFLCELFGPLLSILLGKRFGFDGIAWGITIGEYIGLGLFLLILRMRFGKKGFPLYLPESEEEILSFDSTVTDDTIVSLRNQVLHEMDKRQFTNAKAGLLVEELLTRIRDRNPGKAVLTELTLFFSDNRMRLIVRDNGVIFDYINEDNQADSLNAYVLSSILSKIQSKNYIVTTSFNRNGFIFTKD